MRELLTELKKAILTYDTRGAASFAVNAIEEGIDPLEAMNVAIEAIKDIGDRYGRGDAWLPDLVGGANALTAAISVLQENLNKSGKKRRTLGTVVIGTVCGDVHSIGKDMVAVLAKAEGFAVVDLGVDVKSDVFLRAIKEHTAEILAMSALLTTTAYEQRKVIEMLKDEGLREKTKVVVGGGAITDGFAKSIGADGYEPTAPMAVKLFRKLLGKDE